MVCYLCRALSPDAPGFLRRQTLEQPQLASATPRQVVAGNSIPLEPALRGLAEKSKIHRAKPTRRNPRTFQPENERLESDLNFGLDGANNFPFHSSADLSCIDLDRKLKVFLFSPPLNKSFYPYYRRRSPGVKLRKLALGKHTLFLFCLKRINSTV